MSMYVRKFGVLKHKITPGLEVKGLNVLNIVIIVENVVSVHTYMYVEASTRSGRSLIVHSVCIDFVYRE